ncbi:MAG TPA: hypothetical protein VL574_15435 [Stellaceae bacterium]|nr:hypothetical protein [Stellaceae bacterium]
MKALVKTVIGDRNNVVTVALIVGLEIALTTIGHADMAVFLTPAAVLVAAFWLAQH